MRPSLALHEVQAFWQSAFDLDALRRAVLRLSDLLTYRWAEQMRSYVSEPTRALESECAFDLQPDDAVQELVGFLDARGGNEIGSLARMQ